MRAERKSPQTLKAYGDGVRAYRKWCDENGHEPSLSRAQVRGFVDNLLTNGSPPATARSRQLSVRRFSAWLAEEGEIDTDHLAGMKPPKIDQTVVEPLGSDQLKALIKACAGPDMRAKRDEAIVRLMLETGARAGKTAAIKMSDVDLTKGVVVIRRGRGEGSRGPRRPRDRQGHRPVHPRPTYPPPCRQ